VSPRNGASPVCAWRRLPDMESKGELIKRHEYLTKSGLLANISLPEKYRPIVFENGLDLNRYMTGGTGEGGGLLTC